jgi:ribosome recycling factor
MINDIQQDASARMGKSVEALQKAFTKIRTGRAHPSLLDQITVSYYGAATPLSQVANVSVDDSRTLKVTPWEKDMVKAIEKAIMTSGLGLNPTTQGLVIRIICDHETALQFKRGSSIGKNLSFYIWS